MNIEYAINEVISYARDDTHGYQLHCRDLDYGLDCAGLMMLYASLVEGVPFNQYPNVHTWTMVDVMGGRGWRVIGFSEGAKRRGDVLVRSDPHGGTGHTCLYLGNGEIVEAANDYDGRRGDSSGQEIRKRSYYAYGYDKILRWEGVMAEVDKVENGIYRLYNANSGMHHFTASHEEASALVGAGWTLEGVPASTKGGTVQNYRLYNPNNGAHLVTSGKAETLELACNGWILEGYAFRTPSAGTRFYRLYNPGNGDHLYTCSTDEIDSCLAAGWREEGLAFYSA